MRWCRGWRIEENLLPPVDFGMAGHRVHRMTREADSSRLCNEVATAGFIRLNALRPPVAANMQEKMLMDCAGTKILLFEMKGVT